LLRQRGAVVLATQKGRGNICRRFGNLIHAKSNRLQQSELRCGFKPFFKQIRFVFGIELCVPRLRRIAAHAQPAQRALHADRLALLGRHALRRFENSIELGRLTD
jgi:hypothetical protein